MGLFVYYLLISLLACCSSSEHNYKYSIGPVCECFDEAMPIGDIIKTCYRRCLMDPEPLDRVSVQIHQSMSSSSGPPVVECTKIRQKQTFSKTWTFSTIAGPLTQTTIPVTKEECENAIMENCPSYACNHREPDSIDGEYHYGSDTQVIRDTVSLLTVPSSIMVMSGKLKISPMSTPDLYSDEERYGEHAMTKYLWKESIKDSSCPFEAAATYGCDRYSGSDGNTYYMCAGGRFSITPADKNRPVAAQICPDLYRSEEGFLFKVLPVSASSDLHSRIYITQTQGMSGDIDYLRHKIQQTATHLDSEICSNQCEILAMESRLNRMNDPILRVGMSYYKMYGNGTATKCKTIHGCRLSEPKIMCGNPPRVGITCATNSGLWDPLKPYTEPSGSCPKPDKVEKLTFSLGSEHYVVDDDLTIMAERNFSHGVYPTSFSDLHQGGIQMKIQDLQRLKNDWVSAKDYGSFSKTTVSRSNVSSTASDLGESVMGYVEKIPNFFNSVEHAVGTGVIVLASMMFLWLASKIIRAFPSNRTENAPRERAEVVPLNPQSGSWI
ncbi:TPA_asm: G [Mentha alphacytorhabdovirus 1]|nr:TPA_asm: G [Mentha alphacytorhabdovirus 1]